MKHILVKNPILIVSDKDKFVLPINEVRIILSEWLYKKSLSYITYYAEDDFVTYNKCDKTSNDTNFYSGCDCIILDNIDKIEFVTKKRWCEKKRIQWRNCFRI